MQTLYVSVLVLMQLFFCVMHFMLFQYLKLHVSRLL